MNDISVFEQRIDELKANKKSIYPGEEMLDIIDTTDLEDMKPADLYDTLASQNIQQNEDDTEEGCTDDPTFESFGYTGNLGQSVKDTSDDCKFKTIRLPDEEKLKAITRRLVTEQMDALRMVVETMKNVIRARENYNLCFEPLRLIVHGGAGVGKSAFIRAASLQAEKILRKPGDDPRLPNVLICAPTGKAASLIGESL